MLQERLNSVGRVVGGPIIHDQYFKILMRLVEGAFDAPSDHVCPIIGRYDDAYLCQANLLRALRPIVCVVLVASTDDPEILVNIIGAGVPTAAEGLSLMTITIARQMPCINALNFSDAANLLRP